MSLLGFFSFMLVVGNGWLGNYNLLTIKKNYNIFFYNNYLRFLFIIIMI